MTFDQWWKANYEDEYPDGFANRTFGEEVWQVSKQDTWATVFQIVSDNAHMAEREFIKKLEAARDSDGFGPTA